MLGSNMVHTPHVATKEGGGWKCTRARKTTMESRRRTSSSVAQFSKGLHQKTEVVAQPVNAHHIPTAAEASFIISSLEKATKSFQKENAAIREHNP